MKRRNGSVLPISLMAILLTTTVAYAGIAGQSADVTAQEALSTAVVTDKEDTSASQDAVSDLTYDDIRLAGVAAQFSGADESASKAAAASDTSASSVKEKLAEATEQKEQEQKEKEAQWEGRAIASNVEEYVYIRVAAGTDGDIVGKLPRGGAGDVLEKGDEWTLISSGEVEGYVSNDYLAFDAEALAVAEEVCSYVATVEIDEASIRSEADENAEVLTTASTGEVLNVVEEDGDWIKVETAECVGYLSGDVAHVELAVAEAEPIETEEADAADAQTADEASAEETSAEETSTEDTSAAATSAEESGAEDASSVEETQAEETSATVSSASSAATSHSATFKVTAYCACSKCCGSYANGITATGTTATAGRTIAVDKSVIPLGTTVYINGVAYIAEDTGVYGNWIDLYMDSHDAALQWGVQYCTVTW